MSPPEQPTLPEIRTEDQIDGLFFFDTSLMKTISTNKPISAAKKTSQYRYFPIPMLYLMSLFKTALNGQYQPFWKFQQNRVFSQRQRHQLLSKNTKNVNSIAKPSGKHANRADGFLVQKRLYHTHTQTVNKLQQIISCSNTEVSKYLMNHELPIIARAVRVNTVISNAKCLFLDLFCKNLLLLKLF